MISQSATTRVADFIISYRRDHMLDLTSSLLHEAPLAFLDVETTGLRPDLGDRVVEIAVLRTQGPTEVARFVSLVNPGRRLGMGAAQVNGITEAMLVDAPAFGDLLDRVLPLLEGVAVVCHNVPFDLSFLEAELCRAGVPVWDGIALDTLAFARRQYWFRRNSLAAIASQLGIRPTGAHRALADVLTTQAVFRRFAGRLREQQRPLVADWLRMQGGRVWRPSSRTEWTTD
jgi:DNA polymerase III epsilon subunit family exonuclease